MVDRSEATPKQAGWVLIENEGAIFRGPGRSHPREVWNPGSGWKTYLGADLYKPIEWGDVISEQEAFVLMQLREAQQRPRTRGHTR